MDQTNTPSASGEQPTPAQVTDNAPGSGEQPIVTSDPKAILGDMGESDLLATIRMAEAGIPAEDAAPVAEPAAPPAPGVKPEPPVAEEPEPPAAPADQPNKQNPVTKRIRLSEDAAGLVSQANELVRLGSSTDFASAMASLVGGKAPVQAVAPPDNQNAAAPVTDAAPTPDPLVQIATDLADLRAKRKEADEAFDKDLYDRLTIEIEDKVGERSELRAQARSAEQLAKAQQQAKALTHEQAYEVACDELEVIYPELKDPSSTFSKILGYRVSAAEVAGDPALADPRHILQFGDEIAKDLGLGKKSATAAAPAPLPLAPPTQQARPTGSTVAPGNTPPARPSHSEVRTVMNNATLEEMAACFTS